MGFFTTSRNQTADSPEEEEQMPLKRTSRIIESDEEEAHENTESSQSIDKENAEKSPAQKKQKRESPVKKDEKAPAKKNFFDLMSSKPKSKVEAPGSTLKNTVSKETNVADGEVMSYRELCAVFEKIEGTTKRLQILEYLVDFYVHVIKRSPSSLLPIVYLCLNKVGPEYEGVELGIGESLLLKAVANASGQNTKAVKSQLAKVGDLGDVAQQSRAKQKTMFKAKPLTVQHVFKVLKEIAAISGQSSQQRKVDKINSLMVACEESEPKYLIRSLEGRLRIGLAEQTVLVGLAHASVIANQRKPGPEVLDEAASVLKSVYHELPSYDLIIPSLLEHGVFNLSKHCKLTPGIPLKPMLAHPTKSLTEVLDRFEGNEFTCEFKYDGERAQIHRLENGQAMVFSRNSENLSQKYPDIIARIDKIAKENTTSYVLDCEAVAWDTENKCILPFQVLSTRKRKDVSEANIKVQVCVFAFDLLYLNGEPVTGKTLKERRQLMRDHFCEIEGEFLFAKYLDTHSIDEIQAFLETSVTGNCEGLMVKTLEKDSTYEPSKRSRNWLKVKKDYLSGVGDTVDLVVIGAYTGRGKRTGVYGGYLLACYDDENDEYQSICKIGTGFSDQDLATHAAFFKDHILSGPKAYYKFGDNPNVLPDVWFDAVQVWEVKCADLSISPVHKAAMGIVDSTKGISLRFPRFLRIRDDKGPEQATNAQQIAEMYRSQQINTQNGKDSDGEEF